MPDHHETDPALSTVMDERRQLLGLGYRLLGSAVEAEDAVQETYTRWYALTDDERAAIDNPGAWLMKVASRICLDQLRSARVRRERYVGEWVPEPLPDGTDWLGLSAGAPADPADRVTLDESVSMAFLVVLESMTPAERVAFILHDVFGYSFAEIGDVVGRSDAACRQLASSARRRLRSADAPPAPTEQQAAVVHSFKQAWEARDIDALLALLDPEATSVADGGGRARARIEPATGPEEIAHGLLNVAVAFAELTVLERTVNGQPGLVVLHGGETVTVMAFDIVGDRIRHIWAIRNPDKLGPWR